MSRFIIIVAAVAAVWAGCKSGGAGIPAEFVGTWKTASGVVLTLRDDGTASLIQSIDHKHADYESLCIKVGPDTIASIPAHFSGSNALEISQPLLYGRTYRIDRSPYEEKGRTEMVLNGVTFSKQ